MDLDPRRGTNVSGRPNPLTDGQMNRIDRNLRNISLNITPLETITMNELWFLFNFQVDDDTYTRYNIPYGSIRSEFEKRQGRLETLLTPLTRETGEISQERIVVYVQGLSDDDIQFLANNIRYYQIEQLTLVPTIGNADINIRIAQEVRIQLTQRQSLTFQDFDNLIKAIRELFNFLDRADDVDSDEDED